MLPLIQRIKAEQQHATQLHLLIIEPDAEAGAFLQRQLGAGYQVSVAANGRSALNAFATNPPNLLLIDSILPDIDMLTLLENVRQLPNGRQLPIIILGQSDDPRSLKLAALELGVDDYVTKPFDSEELRYRIRNILPNPHLNADHITGLPGWLSAEYRLQQLRHQTGWYCLLAHIRHFAGFRTTYGYVAANRVLRDVATLLEQVMTSNGRPTDFVGYLGEQDFVILTTNQEPTTLKNKLQYQFQQALPNWYTPPDLARQGVTDADGRSYPLMQLAIGWVQNSNGHYQTPLDILATVASQLPSG